MTDTGIGASGFLAQPPQQPQPPKPPKKKSWGCACGCLVAAAVAVILVLVIGAAILLLLPDGEEAAAGAVSYDKELTGTETTELVQTLAAGGDALTPGYEGGQNGIWGVEQPEGAAGTDKFRPHYVNVEGSQNVTVMVYMIGSDLETEDGSATGDLKEMVDSQNGENLAITVQTGGAKQWHNSQVSSDTRQRFLIQNGEMTLADDAGPGTMVSGQAITDFIDWSARSFPADRYMLLFWDHGGGTIAGFGYDELEDNDDMLSLADLAGAVQASGVSFDLVGFDACLMGSLEAGCAFEPYADYLLASEEAEPGYGWYYTDTFAELSKRPDMPTLEFGARMIDDFDRFYESDDSVTLSLTDLRELPALYEQYVTYYSSALAQLKLSKDCFTSISSARSKSRSFAEGEYEQIDLADFVQRTDISGGDDLIRGIFSAVKYRNAAVGTGAYGLAAYFPYTEVEYYQGVMEDLRAINCDGAQPFFNQFLSILSSGSGGSQSMISQFFGGSQTQDYTSEDWYDSGAAEGYDYNVIPDSEDLVVNYDEKEEAYLLHLSDEEWEAITDIQLQVFLDDGEGYIDLGSDQLYNWTDAGDLILDFDNSWTSIDGNPVAYYALNSTEEGDATVFLGTIPAILNDTTTIDLYLQWIVDADGNSEASVLGYLPQTEGNRPLAKGYFALKKGDVLQPICDYYTYDGEYEDSYVFGDPITVTSMEALAIDSYDLEEATTLCWFQLTDWYNQYWYTEEIEISY